MADYAYRIAQKKRVQFHLLRGGTTMNSSNGRRQELVRELDRINREILKTQKSITQIESKIGSLQDRPQVKAA